jgi:hypothetical protein
VHLPALFGVADLQSGAQPAPVTVGGRVSLAAAALVEQVVQLVMVDLHVRAADGRFERHSTGTGTGTGASAGAGTGVASVAAAAGKVLLRVHGGKDVTNRPRDDAPVCIVGLAAAAIRRALGRLLLAAVSFDTAEHRVCLACAGLPVSEYGSVYAAQDCIDGGPHEGVDVLL